MKKGVYFLLLLLVFSLLLAGCRNPVDIFKSYVFGEPEQEENPLDEDLSIEDVENLEVPDENSRQTTLYYTDSTGYVVPVVRQIPRVEGIAVAALNALVDSPENRSDLKALGLQPVLPANTEIELAIKEGGLANVNLTGEVLKVESKDQEEKMVMAVVYTLTEFETIDNVQIMVDNKILETLTYGTDVSQPIGRGNINALNNDIEGEHAKMTLYLYNNPTGQYTYFVPVTKKVAANARNIESAVKELISSKGEIAELQLNIPEGTTVYGVNIESGVAYVNFSEHLSKMEDVEEMKNIAKAVGLTLKEFEGVTGVRLMVEGKAISQLGSDPITIPTFANTY
ncbi:GerMN domain-containing protein [Irregularibacter muris]|uniref:GerMN domain-containing protein n=1 Tax=Irregularibacter muris TaxID=1796619 RepID=A0AAE3HGQ3_9FIRM|nr:GerMN domain-containing protein [Irregularibacter muris]MCR1898768.1 GerMN domain-containing protein [Irregularibacter muris]